MDTNETLVTEVPETTNRKLASIQKILDIQPIAGADAIEVATVLGWKVVVGKKDNFKVGDLIVYCEIDSILPDKPEYEFLRAKHFRIKTIKLRGQISQGIVFPLTVLPQHLQEQFANCTETDKLLGIDVTETLGITKYEIYVPANLRGQIKGNFPSFLHKTDETRIQAAPDVLTRHNGKRFFVTEKVDGTSFTAYLRNGEFGICSRNLELKLEDDTIYCRMAKELNLSERLARVGKNIAIQGELIGQGIQKNKYGLSNVQLKLFNVFDIDLGRYAAQDEFLKTAALLELETVPNVLTLELDNTTVDALVELSKGFSLLNPKTPREGLVFRPEIETYDPDLKGRLSFKVINPEFLLKYDE